MKEPSSLPDLQLSRDDRALRLEAVGVRELVLPLRLLSSNGDELRVPAKWESTVSLAPELRGTHMSRFVSSIEEFGTEALANLNFSTFVKNLRRRLQSDEIRIAVEFPHFFLKSAPVTGAVSSMNLPCRLLVQDSEGQKEPQHRLSIELAASNLCPCSKAISDAGAHNQRIFIRVDFMLAAPEVWGLALLEQLVQRLETAASSPVFPLLKRPDEKAVTERQYANPKFVEDVTRDAALILREFEHLEGFAVEVEALESIHSHNAVARYSEGRLLR